MNEDLALVSLLLLFSACDKNDYAVISERDFASPDNSRIARIIVETYFNTTGYEKRVTLRRKGQRPRAATLVEGFGPGDEVRLRWQGSTNLVVRYKSDQPESELRRKAKDVHSVLVTFEIIPENEAQGREWLRTGRPIRAWNLG